MIIRELFFVFLLLAFNGLVISYPIFKDDNKLIRIGSAMIIGLLGYLLILSALSYFLKGIFWLNIIFYSYFVVCFLVFIKFIWNKDFIDQFRVKFSRSKILLLLLISFYVFFFFLFGSGYAAEGDSNLYWGIATSFTRGNYPTVLSWQPNFLTVYHQGTFLVEGAIRALVPMDISTIHNFFTAFVLSAIMIFITGIGWKISRSVLAIIPGVLLLILVGGPVILQSSYLNFFSNVLNTQGETVRTHFKNIFYNLASYPTYGYFQGSNGGGVVSIKELFYNNFYTFGLSAFILFTYLFLKEFNKGFKLKNYLFLTILVFLILGIDETFFMVGFLMFAGLFFYEFIRTPVKKVLLNLVIIGCLSVLLFLIIQNPIRDSIFTPTPVYSRFKLVIENDMPFFRNITYRKGQTIDWNGIKGSITAANWPAASSISYGAEKVVKINGSTWKKIDYRWVLGIMILTFIFIRSRYVKILVTSSALAYVISLLVINTYWPPNVLRIVNQAAQILILAIGFLILYLWKIKNKKMSIPLLLVTLVIFLPQLLVSHAKFVVEAIYTPHTYFTTNQRNSFLAELEKIVPDSYRIIFVEDYPDQISPDITNRAYSRHGFFVPMAPVEPKVLNPALGMEWYDAANKLAPYALKKLDISYVVVTEKGLSHLSERRKFELIDTSYFKFIKKFDEGVLYEVTDKFKNLNDNEGTIENLISLIERNKKVYLDKFSPAELRQVFLLNLSNRDHLVGKPTAHGGDFFMYIETDIPLERICPDPCDPKTIKSIKGIEYAVMSPEDDPNIILDGNFEKIDSVTHVDLWRRKEQ